MLDTVGRSVPPSKLRVAVEPAPRTVGNAGRWTSAVPPMLMVAVLVGPAASKVKLFAQKYPPVRFNVETTPAEPAVAPPPIDRIPTFAVPPVWLNRAVPLLTAASERPICRIALPFAPPAVFMFREPVPLRLKVAVVAALPLTTNMTPRVALAIVVMLPPLRL